MKTFLFTLTRMQALQELMTEMMGRRLTKRLTQTEFDLVVDFIAEYDALPHLEFEYKVNKWFLDMPKPKNISIMQEILISANFRAHGRKR